MTFLARGSSHFPLGYRRGFLFRHSLAVSRHPRHPFLNLTENHCRTLGELRELPGQGLDLHCQLPKRFNGVTAHPWSLVLALSLLRTGLAGLTHRRLDWSRHALLLSGSFSPLDREGGFRPLHPRTRWALTLAVSVHVISKCECE